MTSVLAMDHLYDLAPISLDDLVARAALLVRVDRKYVLARADAEMLVATLPRGTKVLEIEGSRTVGYTSLYFDNARLDSYRHTAQHRRTRFKVRTRSYATGGSFLEVKTRRGAHTVKERIAWDLPSNLRLDERAETYVAERLDAARVGDPGLLTATLWTRYERSTLVLPGEGSRLTIDQGPRRVLVPVPREADLFHRMEAARDAVRAVGRSPLVALAAEPPALAEESFLAFVGHEHVPHVLEGVGHHAADDDRGVLQLRLDLLRHDSTSIRCASGPGTVPGELVPGRRGHRLVPHPSASTNPFVRRMERLVDSGTFAP